VRLAYVPSFWIGRSFRKLMGTPFLDTVVAATNQPTIKTLTGKLLAQM